MPSLSGTTATNLVDAIEATAEEVGADACQIICEAKALICANPQLQEQCTRITALAVEYGCECGTET